MHPAHVWTRPDWVCSDLVRLAQTAMTVLGAIGCALLLAACGGGGSSESSATSAPETTEAQTGGETSGGAANAELGEETFAANGCANCHTLAAAGASGTVGPDFDEVLPGKSEAFIRESIVEPEAQIAPGYSGGIMPTTFGETLSEGELEALVAYLHQEAGK